MVLIRRSILCGLFFLLGGCVGVSLEAPDEQGDEEALMREFPAVELTRARPIYSFDFTCAARASCETALAVLPGATDGVDEFVAEVLKDDPRNVDNPWGRGNAVTILELELHCTAAGTRGRVDVGEAKGWLWATLDERGKPRYFRFVDGVWHGIDPVAKTGALAGGAPLVCDGKVELDDALAASPLFHANTIRPIMISTRDSR